MYLHYKITQRTIFHLNYVHIFVISIPFICSGVQLCGTNYQETGDILCCSHASKKCLVTLLSPSNEVWGRVIFSGRNEVVAKVMFLQASAILSTGVGGGECLPQCMLWYHTPGADTPQIRHTPIPLGADTPQEQTPPEHTPWEQTPPD